MSKNKREMPPKTYHAIRIIIGLYLLYTDYTIVKGNNSTSGDYEIFMLICMVAFAVTGLALLFFSGKALIQIMMDDRNPKDDDKTTKK